VRTLEIDLLRDGGDGVAEEEGSNIVLVEGEPIP
jgi:hypothetical protein